MMPLSPHRPRRIGWDGVRDVVAGCLIIGSWALFLLGLFLREKLPPQPESLDSLTPGEQPLPAAPPPPTTAPTPSRRRREVGPSNNTAGDYCLDTYGGVTLDYVLGANTVFKFDLCKVMNCGGNPTAWRPYDVYLCDSYSGWCPHWGNVLWGTGPHYEKGGYVQKRPQSANTSPFQKAGSMARAFTNGGVEILLTLKNVTSSPYVTGKRGTYCGKENHTVYLVFGWNRHVSGWNRHERPDQIAIVEPPAKR